MPQQTAQEQKKKQLDIVAVSIALFSLVISVWVAIMNNRAAYETMYTQFQNEAVGEIYSRLSSFRTELHENIEGACLANRSRYIVNSDNALSQAKVEELSLFINKHVWRITDDKTYSAVGQFLSDLYSVSYNTREQNPKKVRDRQSDLSMYYITNITLIARVSSVLSSLREQVTSRPAVTTTYILKNVVKSYEFSGLSGEATAECKDRFSSVLKTFWEPAYYKH